MEKESFPMPESINNSVMSFNRHGFLLMKQSLSPLRLYLLVMLTSLNSSGRNPSSLFRMRVTSAMLTGLRVCDPANTISSIFLPRRFFADCSPNTQRTASERLLLPLPFGPTTAVTPSSNSITVLSANDLKPDISILSRCKENILSGETCFSFF